MRSTLVAVVVLLSSILMSACGSDPTCDDVESLTEQLAETEPDDPEFNDLVNKLNQAQADCNAG